MTGEKDAKSPYDAFFYYRSEQLQAVRSGRWKLILEHKEPETKSTIPQSLYDLKTDISETTDVSAKHPKVVAMLLAMADKCRGDLGDAITGVKGKNRRPCGKVD
jgi:arylsulfatase A